jgi:hypothetical protein
MCACACACSHTPPDNLCHIHVPQVATDAFAELFGRAIMPSIDLVWFSISLYRLMGTRGLMYLGGYAVPLILS